MYMKEESWKFFPSSPPLGSTIAKLRSQALPKKIPGARLDKRVTTRLRRELGTLEGFWQRWTIESATDVDERHIRVTELIEQKLGSQGPKLLEEGPCGLITICWLSSVKVRKELTKRRFQVVGDTRKKISHHALRWVGRLVESQERLEIKAGLRTDLVGVPGSVTWFYMFGEWWLWNRALVRCLAGTDYGMQELISDDLVMGFGLCPWSLIFAWQDFEFRYRCCTDVS
ncbi:hypothetical protein M9H77_17454 [Catharanthus roseus]|uniref:Uncharacterized protein n=1 Tax=Catharanthus roseus TaxID=4058 RepID=A0ACC0B4N0_CATRO|nr:hypothetical protein M9H77_17454 [Catharanthus roseus]